MYELFCVGWRRRHFWGYGENGAPGVVVPAEVWGGLDNPGDSLVKRTRTCLVVHPARSWPQVPYFCFSPSNWLDFYSLSHTRILSLAFASPHQHFFLFISFLFSSPCFFSPFACLPSQSLFPQAFFSPSTLNAFLPFQFCLLVLPPCSEISLLPLRVGKEIFLFNSSFLGLERASRVYPGILGNRTRVSEQGRFPHRVCVWGSASRRARRLPWAPRLRRPLADSSPVSRFSRTVTPFSWGFWFFITTFSLSFLFLLFPLSVSISLLFFSPIFHISPCSFFSSGFPYVLEMMPLSSLVSLFGFGR